MIISFPKLTLVWGACARQGLYHFTKSKGKAVRAGVSDGILEEAYKPSYAAEQRFVVSLADACSSGWKVLIKIKMWEKGKESTLTIIESSLSYGH